MSALWEPNKNYRRLNMESVPFSGFGYVVSGFGYADFPPHFLPYRRLYQNLSEQQLRELLADAKKHRWQVLDLRDCGLESLPEDGWNLPDLRVLYLGRVSPHGLLRAGASMGNENVFARLPDSMKLLSNLQILQLSGHQITEIPQCISNFKKLQALFLIKTNIGTLPDFIGNLTDLEVLYLCENRLDELPAFIGNLTNLQILNLCMTQIDTLPDSFRNLINLQQLYLHETNVSALPDSFRNLRNLQRLTLDDTPLQKSGNLPSEILSQSPQEIIRYILAMQSEKAPKRYFNESKMIVVGEARTGKSCVINRLLHRKYNEQHTTEGIDIEQWKFPSGGEEYTLNVWDLGGQEIYHATHQFFLTQRTLYLLVWDAQAEPERGRLDYWMKTIRLLGGDEEKEDEPPVILIGNKCDKDLGRWKRVEHAIQDRYPQIRAIFYVSCQDNFHIEKLRKYTRSQALKLPLMKTKWLDTWLSVRKELEERSKKENYISYDEYVKICRKRAINDADALSLIKYLHELGVVLYYHNNPLLCQIVILSSEWGTDAVYKILDEQERTLKDRNGILYYKDLPKIWTDTTRYPKGMYLHLLTLMESFQLAFEVHDTSLPEHTYLVAELLNVDPMPHEWPEEGKEPLVFRYVYDFLPAGIMTRLIVSIHEHLETIGDVKQCWLKGAYLKRRSALAKVTLRDDIKSLDIRITGDDPRDRRDLLTIIREHVQKVNNRFKKLDVTELIPCRCSTGCPYFFKYETLRKAELIKGQKVQCHESFQELWPQNLLDGVKPTKAEALSSRDSFDGVVPMKQGNNADKKSPDVHIHTDGAPAYIADGGNIITGSVKKSNVSAHKGNSVQKDEKDEKNPLKIARIVGIVLLVLVILGVSLFALKTGEMSSSEWLDNFPGWIKALLELVPSG